MQRREKLLWVAVVVTAIGDIATTAYGLDAGLSEGNPLLAPLLGVTNPIGVMVLVKVTAIVIVARLRRYVKEGYRFIVPLLLAGTWGIVTLLNIATLLNA